MITSCNCVSGGSGVCILCLFMPFAKVSLAEGLGSLVWVAERWGNVRTNIHEQRAGRSDSKAAFGFRDKICSNFSFGFQVVRVLRHLDSGVTSVLRYHDKFSQHKQYSMETMYNHCTALLQASPYF